MSGTLFIVCIEEIAKNTEEEENEKPRENTILNRSMVPLTNNLAPQHLPFKKDKTKSVLQRTRSCDTIFSNESFVNVDATDSKKKNEEADYANELNIPPNSSMEVVLTKIVEELKIENVNWNKCGRLLSATFTIPHGERQQRCLRLLKKWGIGERRGSSVSMVPCTVILPTNTLDNDQNTFSEGLSAKDQGLWDGFINSVNATMNIAKIVEEIRQDAALTFDFVSLIIIASIMAAFGLIENSIICLTSSMLISPLMGPLIAATFSTVIKDKQLMKFGVINELIGICLATVVGFLFGLVIGSVDERYGVGDGLGDEILSRCEIHSLIVGMFTAIPSGAAVAIAILSENTGSLIGVAISASLLPPAVNAGLLWALAVLFVIHEDNENVYNSVIKSTTYSEHQAVELAILGSISMVLTIINVICIYIMGILFLKIKEVAPVVSQSQERFWQQTKVARDYSKTIARSDGLLKEKLLKDLARFQNLTSNERFPNQNTWSMTNGMTWSPMMYGNGTTKISIQELEKAYHNLNRPRQVNRVGLISVSSSPPQYQQLTNDIPVNDFQIPISRLNGDASNIATSSKMSPKLTLATIPETAQWINEDDESKEFTVVQCNKDIPSKPKFIVTPAKDPLHFIKGQ